MSLPVPSTVVIVPPPLASFRRCRQTLRNLLLSLACNRSYVTLDCYSHLSQCHTQLLYMKIITEIYMY